MFTVKQMKKRGYPKGIPLIWHFGIWGDMALLTPLMAYVVYRYADIWTVGALLAALAVGFVVTAGMVFLWTVGTKTGLPESHAHKGRLTMAGLFHGLYMWGVVTVVILLFFCSFATRFDKILVALVLGVHFVPGTHIVLGLLAERNGWEWYPDRPHKQRFTWVVLIGTWSLLAAAYFFTS
ncbi:MAG: hypothetical protein HGB08_04775 [Candidatus Moranbacteria bacterium]|nr:hypothetical protein [Candidatus Moranbacteria bacterium]